MSADHDEEAAANASWLASHPYLMALSTSDALAADAGGVAAITGRLVEGIAADLTHLGYKAGTNFFPDDGNGLVAVDFEGANVFIMLFPVDRFADRNQWQVKFMNRPDYRQFTEEQRAALAIIHAATAYHIADVGFIEAVDTTMPKDRPMPPKPAPTASALKH